MPQVGIGAGVMPRFYAPFDRTLWASVPHGWQKLDSSLREDLLSTNRVRLWLGRWRRLVDEELEGVIVDSPWGDMIVTPCKYPAANNERWDIPTRMWCRVHNRTIYYCDDIGKLWCDGGPPAFEHHSFALSALSHK